MDQIAIAHLWRVLSDLCYLECFPFCFSTRYKSNLTNCLCIDKYVEWSLVSSGPRAKKCLPDSICRVLWRNGKPTRTNFKRNMFVNGRLTNICALYFWIRQASQFLNGSMMGPSFHKKISGANEARGITIMMGRHSGAALRRSACWWQILQGWRWKMFAQIHMGAAELN